MDLWAGVDILDHVRVTGRRLIQGADLFAARASRMAEEARLSMGDAIVRMFTASEEIRNLGAFMGAQSASLEKRQRSLEALAQALKWPALEVA